MASVWSTGVAEGAKVLDIKSATEAVKILTNEGIEGEFLGGRFVMKIADEREVAAALEHLAWDDQAHLLNYHPQSDPKFSRRYSENEVMREALRENGERTEEPIREEVTEKLRKEVDRVFDQSHDPAANVAIARVQAMNAACAALIQGDGRAQASLKWQAASNAQERYALLSPFLAFAPGELDEYFPEGYGVEFPETLTPLRQLKLWRRAEVSY